MSLDVKKLTRTGKNELSRKLFRTGKWGRRELAEYMGVKEATMREFLRGLPRMITKSKKFVFTEQEEDYFLVQHRAGKSMHRLARESGTGCSPTTVTSAINRARAREQAKHQKR